jgi:DNA repair protein SbcD/Mre11
VVELRPDLVLVAGDVFHTVRPTEQRDRRGVPAVLAGDERLPEVPVVMIAGNHDSPRSTDTGNILALFREIPGLLVVTEEAERVHVGPRRSTPRTMLCLPHNALVERVAGRPRSPRPAALEPDPAPAPTC